MVGDERQHRLNAARPELFCAFYAAVDLFDDRLDLRAGDRKPLAAVLVVLHAAALVGQVPPGFRDLSPRRSLFFCFRQAELLLTRLERCQQLVERAAP